jgi:heterodisulfide reductase subunit D
MSISPQSLARLIRLGMKDEVLISQACWLCTSCNACTTHCPRGIPLLDTVIGLKTYSIANGLRVPDDVKLLRMTIESSHNISGDPNHERLRWSKNLPQPLSAISGRTGADLLYFVGCISAFFPRAFSIPQAFGRTLAHAGVSFTTMGGREWCCGYPLATAGLQEDVGALIEHNYQQVKRLGVSRMVMTCPSCYYTWKVLYPKLAKPLSGVEILHATELLDQLLEERRIRPEPVTRVVTYHDPCDLGRKSGVEDAPRSLLNRLPGVELREMANIRSNGLCCGGGGDVKILSHDTTMDVARRRIRQALDVKADTVVSACQQCKRALTGAVQWMRKPIKVVDVAELVWESLTDTVQW